MGLILSEAVANNPDGSGVTLSVQLFFSPGNAGATVALRDHVEWQDDTALGGEVLQITSRQSDGMDLPIPGTAPQIGTFSSTGIAFDPAMSSVTYGFFIAGAFAQWVLQVIFF